ncbi:MAG TPA: site-specific integrase [Solirubrobacteraceae bacterium]|nr:site-specific integrase [Solirubrobacteraceae bacterium]
MQNHPPDTRISGHVHLRDGKRGGVYYLKYRQRDGRQVKHRLGPAWDGRGRPPTGHFTRRMAEDQLQAVLTDARRGVLVCPRRTGVTFAETAAEWLRYVERDRDVKQSTLYDYRHMVARLNRDFGATAIERIDHHTIESWQERQTCSNRTTQKYLIALNGIFKRALKKHGLATNPVTLVERPRVRNSHDIDVLTAAEIRALVRHTATEIHATLFLTAAFTGLRLGELLALRWGEVDFSHATIRVVRSFTLGGESSPKSGKSRSVPMVAEVAHALARLSQRDRFTGDQDRVFAGTIGGHLDGKQLRAVYKQALADAGLRNLRFHDLRHTFGTRAVEHADSILELKEWMGHADVQTTMRYLHYKSKTDAAARLSRAFAEEAAPQDHPTTNPALLKL